MKKAIVNFFKESKLATICCIDGKNTPYCFQCFYAFDENNFLLFFKSSSETLHAKLLKENPAVAGTVQVEKVELLSLKGIQFTGTIADDDLHESIKPESFYHRKFPFALAMKGHVWCIRLEMVKMTDNSQVFGRKRIWKREEN